MKKIKQGLKFGQMLGYVSGYFATRGAAALAYKKPCPMGKRKDLLFIEKFWTKRAIKLAGIDIKLKGQDLDPSKNYLIVSNHLSYLDILVIQHVLPSCFVAAVEIKETPGLGHITRLSGCLFVERRDKSNIKNEISEISEALARGLNVALFPEAATTNGESVLRFRRPLYEAALSSKKEVKPICLNYTSVDGEPIGSHNRDHLFWYDDMPFASHFWRVMGFKKIEVEVSVLDEIPAEDSLEASDLAEKSHEMVSSEFRPIQ